MGAGFEMLLSGTPLGVVLGVGLIAAIGFFIHLALRGDKPGKPK